MPHLRHASEQTHLGYAEELVAPVLDVARQMGGSEESFSIVSRRHLPSKTTLCFNESDNSEKNSLGVALSRKQRKLSMDQLSVSQRQDSDNRTDHECLFFGKHNDIFGDFGVGEASTP